MRETFAAIVPWATLVFAVSSMLAVGLANPASEIVEPLKRWPRVIRALAANFLLAPALAYVLARAFGLEMPYAVGLFVVGSAAGAPFLLKLTEAAKGDLAFAASLLLLLLPLTVAFIPLVLPTVLPEAEVSIWAIAQPLLLSMLLPLAAGLLLRPMAPGLASTTHPWLNRISTLALIAILVSVVIGDWEALTSVPLPAWVASALFLGGAFGIGLALGGREHDTRNAIALGTAQRNIAAATVVATQTFAGIPGVVVMVTAFSVVGLLVLFPVAFTIRGRTSEPAPVGAPRRRHA